MKKLIFLITIFLLLISNNISAWEATFDAGYYGRLFNQKDQLGATKPKQDTKFNFTNGLALNGNLLFGARSFSFGPELSFNYGLTDTKSLQTQAVALSLMSQYNHGPLNFGLKTGVVTNILTEDFMDKIDADTGFIFSFKGSADIFEGQQFFFEPQLFLSPSTVSAGSFVPSFAFAIGVQKTIKSAPVRIEQPKQAEKPIVVSPAPVVLPKEPTPVMVEERKPEPIKLPEPVTPTQVEKPKPLVLKFNENNLSEESTGFLENVIKIHNSVLSIIKINYSSGKNAKKKSEVLYNWFVEHGVKKEEVQTIPGLKGKEIKLEVTPK